MPPASEEGCARDREEAGDVSRPITDYDHGFEEQCIAPTTYRPPTYVSEQDGERYTPCDACGEMSLIPAGPVAIPRLICGDCVGNELRTELDAAPRHHSRRGTDQALLEECLHFAGPRPTQPGEELGW